MEPRERALDDPAGAAEATAVRGVAARQLGADPAGLEIVPMRLRVVGAIALHQPGLPAWRARAAAQRRDPMHQGEELGHIVAMGGRDDRGQRNPPRLGEKVVFRPRLAAIGRVRSSFFPPRSARTEELSTMARARSSWPRCRSSASKTA